MHRDIKLENLLLSSGLNLKLCDFGLSTSFKNNNNIICGTKDYLAPEIILN